MPDNIDPHPARRNKAAVFGSGAVIGTLGGLVGLGGAEFRLPLLIKLFRFHGLEAVILNKAVSLVVVATALLFTIKGCWPSWEGGRTEQRTDDAYLRADLTPLSTRISGTVRKMEVGDYQAVQPGQLLVQLEDDDYAAALAEAKAALAGAQAQGSNGLAAQSGWQKQQAIE